MTLRPPKNCWPTIVKMTASTVFFKNSVNGQDERALTHTICLSAWLIFRAVALNSERTVFS